MILAASLKIVELEFPDGSNPPKAIIKQWLQIVMDHFGSPSKQKKSDTPKQEAKMKAHVNLFARNDFSPKETVSPIGINERSN